MPGYWHTEAPENPGVLAGYVELYFRMSQRLFVLKFPGAKTELSSSICRPTYEGGIPRPGLSGKNQTSLRKPASNLLTSLVAATTRFATNWTIKTDKLERPFFGDM
jgi:hypothetical protein